MTTPTFKLCFKMNLLPEKIYGIHSRNFVKKNVLCEKGDKIPDLTVPKKQTSVSTKTLKHVY
jgi:hypothetical protein